jgi:hypothetical protein
VASFDFMALDVGAVAGAKSQTLSMAGASRRGYGEDGIYFDHRADYHDSAYHGPVRDAGEG